MAVTIRPATPDDADQVVAMVRALSTHEGQPPPGFTPARFRALAFGPEAVYRTLIAEAAGQAVGMVAFNRSFSSQTGEVGLRIVDLYVAEPWRRSGIGRRLMVAAGQEARRLGGNWISWTVRADNPVALGFYRALGATLDDDLLMYFHDAGLSRLLAGEGVQRD